MLPLRDIFLIIALFSPPVCKLRSENTLRRWSASHPLQHSQSHYNKTTSDLSISIIWCIWKAPSEGWRHDSSGSVPPGRAWNKVLEWSHSQIRLLPWSPSLSSPRRSGAPAALQLRFSVFLSIFSPNDLVFFFSLCFAAAWASLGSGGHIDWGGWLAKHR